MMRRLTIIAALAVMATACGPAVVDTADSTILVAFETFERLAWVASR